MEEKFSINKLIQNKKLVAIFIIFLICLSGAFLFFSRDKNKPLVFPEIEEPEAPLAENLNQTNFAAANIEGKTSINQVGSLTNLKPSGNQESYIALVSDGENSNSEDAFSLYVVSNDGSISDTIEKSKVVYADFLGNDYIYYQTIGTGAGIYFYNIPTKVKSLIIYTYDLQSFYNILPISADKYFFVQPKTGKIGFTTISTNTTTILDEKTLDIESNYVQSGAYRYPSISPDMKYIGIYDLSADENQKVKVKILPTNATSMDQIYHEYSVSYPSGGFKTAKEAFSWSKDSKFVATGVGGNIIDIVSKKSLFDEIKDSVIKISPDTSQFIALNYKTGEVILSDLEGKDKNPIINQVSEIEWISKDMLILIIGKRLYVYNTTTNQLNAVSPDKAIYQINAVNAETQTAWVLKDNKALVINQK